MSLDERVQALVHSVELMAQRHVYGERRYEERFARILDIIEKLAHIVDSHERRLNQLES